MDAHWNGICNAVGDIDRAGTERQPKWSMQFGVRSGHGGFGWSHPPPISDWALKPAIAQLEGNACTVAPTRNAAVKQMLRSRRKIIAIPDQTWRRTTIWSTVPPVNRSAFPQCIWANSPFAIAR